ncbi:MAG: hypothetical protein A3J29_23325 [Acidobacteria bacterium RIFCSPLOWO2_12_FULL_67_14b]|nr:MAG: hypothetical protein A3J29_23325 [Acidobacteria bacterium RIFCSPLOWO2_12_FULL_67_14b]
MQRQAMVRGRIPRIGRERLLGVFAAAGLVSGREAELVVAALQVGLVRSWRRRMAGPWRPGQRGRERAGDGGGDLVLHAEQIDQLAIVALRPERAAVRCPDQLRADADAAARFAHAAFEDRADAKRAGDAAHVRRLALEREGGCARDHLEALDPGQRVDDLLGEPVAEVLTVFRWRHVGKRQHRDRDRRLRLQRTGLVEGRPDVGHALEAVGRVLAEAAFDHARQRRGHRERGGLITKNSGQHVRRGGSGEGAAAGDHLVQQRPKTEDIGTVIERLSLRLFRRHVTDRPQHRAGRGPGGIRRIGLHHLGDTEIQQLRRAAVDEHIRGLQVTVQDALVVRGLEGAGDLDGQRRRPIRCDRSMQRKALDVLHHEIVGADVVQRADMGMVQRGDGAGLALEAGDVARLRALDGDRPVQAGVAGGPDFAHPALADERDDLVGAEPHAGGQLHEGEPGL